MLTVCAVSVRAKRVCLSFCITRALFCFLSCFLYETEWVMKRKGVVGGGLLPVIVLPEGC